MAALPNLIPLIFVIYFGRVDGNDSCGIRSTRTEKRERERRRKRIIFTMANKTNINGTLKVSAKIRAWGLKEKR